MSLRVIARDRADAVDQSGSWSCRTPIERSLVSIHPPEQAVSVVSAMGWTDRSVVKL